ncbi:hypothetical protein P692DRAFT_20101781, partial [Suillus brevipes Sb2]
KSTPPAEHCRITATVTSRPLHTLSTDHGRRVYLCSHAAARRVRCFLDFNLFLRCASQLKDDILQPQPHTPTQTGATQNHHSFRYRGERAT